MKMLLRFEGAPLVLIVIACHSFFDLTGVETGVLALLLLALSVMQVVAEKLDAIHAVLMELQSRSSSSV